MTDYLWGIFKSRRAAKWVKREHAHVWTIAANHERAIAPGFAVCCALCGYIDSYLVTTKEPPVGFNNAALANSSRVTQGRGDTMSEPLDLHAYEARLKFGDSLDSAECAALLAALRRMIVALRQPLQDMGADDAPWYDEAVAALASVRDDTP